jgi:hypothetical protein
MIRNFDDLVLALGVTSREEVSDVLDEACDMDADLADVSEEGIVMRVHTSGIGLDYPFSIRTFWQTFEELDEQVRAELEADEDQWRSST